MGALGIACFVLALAAVQFGRIIARDVAYARALGDVRSEITALEQKRVDQEREIRRLRDPQGAIPEIHDRLHMVGDHEAIIYLRHD